MTHDPTHDPTHDLARVEEQARHRDRMLGLWPGHRAQVLSSVRAFVESLPTDAGRELVLLDLGCGSGVSTKALMLELFESGIRCRLTGIDASAGLLAVARSNDWPHSITFEQAMLEDVPALLGERGGAVDGIFAAHLLGQVAARDGFIGDLARHLTPGAPLVVHDFSISGRPRLRRSSRFDAPRAAEVDPTERLMHRMLAAGLEDVRARRAPGLTGALVHTVHGRAPG